MNLRRLLHFLLQQFGDDLIDDLIGQRSHFLLGFGLDGMLDENRLVLRHA